MNAPATNRYTEPRLNDAQRRALDLLAMGRTDAQVAAELDVHRTTVTRWRLYRPVFVAALNRRRAEIRDASSDRLRSMVGVALDRIEREIADGPEGAKLALKVLELAHAAPVGPTSTQSVMERAAPLPRGDMQKVVLCRGLDELERREAAVSLEEGDDADAMQEAAVVSKLLAR